MDTAIALINLLNAETPGIAQLIIMIKGTDGVVSVVALLDAADAKFADNLKQAKDWLAAHQPKQA